MKVSELGEFGLIDLLAAKISGLQDNRTDAYKKLIIGIGDDTAAWKGERSIQLATVDCLIEGVHFTRETSTWQELGWKSLAINLSDIAAMGCMPRYALVSLALPGGTAVDDVSALYDGLLEAARRYEVAIVGGNTARAPQVSITITVTGRRRGKGLLRRSTARPGDKIAVTGHPGSAAAGLQMLTRGLKFSPETTAYLRNAFLRPQPRIAEGQLLVKKGVKTAIDISDGLLADLGHICQASKASARLEAAALPIHPMVRDTFGDEALKMALGGGEDYELLFTAGAEAVRKVKTEAACPVTVIGEIVAGSPGEIKIFDAKGSPVKVPETGWEHFRAA